MDKHEKKFYALKEEGKLKSLKIDEMREFLALKNLPSKGKKEFLVNVIEEYFENHFNLD